MSPSNPFVFSLGEPEYLREYVRQYKVSFQMNRKTLEPLTGEVRVDKTPAGRRVRTEDINAIIGDPKIRTALLMKLNQFLDAADI